MVLRIKKEWNDCIEKGREFQNPVKATTLKMANLEFNLDTRPAMASSFATNRLSRLSGGVTMANSRVSLNTF